MGMLMFLKVKPDEKDLPLMKKLLRSLLPFFCLVAIFAGSAVFFVHPQHARASGTPELYTSNPYDYPYYNHQAIFIGVHFSPSSTVTLSLNYPPVGTFLAGTSQTNAYGKFRFVIQHMPSIPYNNLATLSAKDSHGLQASTSTGEIPFIVAKPIAGSIGSTVHVDGGGYGSSETVNVYFNQAQSLLVSATTTSPIGVFSATFKVPAGSGLGGSNLTIEAKGTSGADTTTIFIVISSIHLSPNQGPSGTAITVTGRYFTPNGQAILDWYNPVSNTTIYLVAPSVSTTGTFQITITAPTGLTAGIHYRVLADDNPSGQGCYAVFTAQS